MGSSKKVTVGYKIYLGMHLVLCHGPVDKIVSIQVDKRRAWLGTSTGGRINIRANGLFGGEKREGGISGDVDFAPGRPDQIQNDYLQARLGNDIPAFLGVAALVLRQVYLGINPYLKKWSGRLQRIHVRRDGLQQWYDSKAEINSSLVPFSVRYTDFSDGWQTNAPTKFQIINGMIANTLVNADNADHWRISLPGWDLTRVYCEFMLIDRDLGDPIGIRFDTDDDQRLFSFMPQAEDAFDVLRRPHVNYWDANLGDLSATPIYGQELDEGVKYAFEALIDTAAAQFTYFLRQGAEVLASGTLGYPVGPLSYAVFGRTSNAQPERTGIAGFSLLEVSGYYSAGEMNPAHIIRECLTDPDWGMGYAEADIDDDAFAAAADRLFSERMGISILWEKQVPIEDFVREVLRHIDAALYVDRRTGRFVLRLIRDDYDVEALPVLGPSEIDRVENYTRPQPIELMNSVTVSYWDAVTGGTATVTVDDPALVQIFGQVRGVTVRYDGFTNRNVSVRAGRRDLRAMSSPLLSATLYVGRAAAKLLNPGDAFKFVWPALHEGWVVMRITRMRLGDGVRNLVQIQCVEDVFALPETQTVADPDDEWENPAQPPQPAEHRIVTELPYFELVQRIGQANADEQLALNPYLGFVTASAARPGSAMNATMMVDAGAGFEDAAVVDFCPFAVLAEPVGPLDTVLEITGAIDLDLLELGTHAQLGPELVRIDGVTDTEITVGRGVLDTVPRAHAAGTPLFGWDQFADGDPTEYAAGETIDVRLLPATGSGMVDLSAAATDQVTFSQRALRPYPPGNFKIENIAYPEGPLVLSAATGVSWSHRDRTQQTSGVFEDTTDLDIGPEPGTTYTVQVYDHQDNLIAESAGVDGTDTAVDTSAAITAELLRFVLFSVRAGLESWQRHEWVVDQSLDLWTPAEITTALWLDAADTDTFTLVSEAVSEWRDKSGNARHATQATAGNRPTRPGGQLNSLPVVRFDGTDDRMNLPALGVSGSDNRTFIAVATMTDPGSDTRLLFHQGGNGTETSRTGDAWRVTLDGGTKNLRIGIHGGGYTSAFNAVGTAIWGVRFEGATLAGNALYKNGVSEQATGTTSINTVDANNRIADIPGTTGKYMSGDVAEIVFIASAIDTPTRERIEGYLAWKWGLVSLLPSEHPYKVVPPVLD